MTFSQDTVLKLQGSLDPSRIKSREGMSYIMAWDATDTANHIFGFDGWDRETTYEQVAENEREMGPENRKYMGWAVSYIAKVRITVRAVDPETENETIVFRDGTGAGHGYDRDLGKAHESAIKEAESDAMKRALSQFGNQFGLALYDKTKASVGVDAYTVALEALEKCSTKAAYHNWRKWFADENIIAQVTNDQRESLEKKAKEVKAKLGIAEDPEEEKAAEKAAKKAKPAKPKKRAPASKGKPASNPSETPPASKGDEPEGSALEARIAEISKELQHIQLGDDLIEFVVKVTPELGSMPEGPRQAVEAAITERAAALGVKISEDGEITEVEPDEGSPPPPQDPPEDDDFDERAEKFKEAVLKLAEEKATTVENVDAIKDKYEDRIAEIQEQLPSVALEIVQGLLKRRQELERAAQGITLDDEIPF